MKQPLAAQVPAPCTSAASACLVPTRTTAPAWAEGIYFQRHQLPKTLSFNSNSVALKAVCHHCTKLFLSHHCHITAEMLRNAPLLLQPRKDIKIHYICKIAGLLCPTAFCLKIWHLPSLSSLLKWFILFLGTCREKALCKHAIFTPQHAVVWQASCADLGQAINYSHH